MTPPWFLKRGYKHFDAPVGELFAQRLHHGACINSHSWSPLIHYVKRVKRYKPLDGHTVYKPRPIMYASHRDACILAKYAFDVTRKLDELYEREGLTSNVIGYRRLGKSNYNFSADAYRFAKARAPCVVLCFDISGFFDHLDHRILKDRLRQLLGGSELPLDWYKVFRQVTRFSYVNRDELTAHANFGPKLKSRSREPIASVAEIKAAGIAITPNPSAFGIPQGTPISSAFSNLYMIDVDRRMATLCAERGALYQRYSDDILVICPAEHEAEIRDALLAAVSSHKLEIKDEKTERVVFDLAKPEAFQYLGFNVRPDGATIRQSSLARQWRKFKYSIKKTRKIAEAAIAAGLAEKVFTKRLRRRFYPIGIRNFSAYARRAAKAFGSKKIARQVGRLERRADKAIRDLNT
jgi:RNA-directed DNA polymerase